MKKAELIEERAELLAELIRLNEFILKEYDLTLRLLPQTAKRSPTYRYQWSIDEQIERITENKEISRKNLDRYKSKLVELAAKATE